MRARAARPVAALFLFAVFVVALAPSAGAHADFLGSTPADGDVIAEPVSEIVLDFSGAVVPTTDGFEVLTPDGVTTRPRFSENEDSTRFVLEFDPPLVDGVVTVRWSVRAGDAHPIEGSFSFTTTAVAPTPTSVAAEPKPAAPTAVVPAPTSTPIAESLAVAPDVNDRSGAEQERTSIEDFLGATSDPTVPSGVLGAVRAASIAAGLVAVGAAAFLLLVRMADPLGADAILRVVTVGAVVLFVATGIEWGLAAVDARPPVTAPLLRMLGAAGLAGLARWWRDSQVSRPLLASFAAIVVASYWFDGHTVTEGNRVLTGLIDFVHIAAAATWAGGLVYLVVLARRSDGDDAAFTPTILRFSSIAAVALAAAGAAGVALAVTVLDDFSSLWTSSWGRLVLAKSVLVGLVALMGAYNRWVLLPEFENTQPMPESTAKLRRTMQGEVLLLAAVAVLTAFLVAASPAG